MFFVFCTSNPAKQKLQPTESSQLSQSYRLHIRRCLPKSSHPGLSPNEKQHSTTFTCLIITYYSLIYYLLTGKRSWVLSGGGRMSPLALGRHGSPTLSPSSSVDQPSAGMRRMYSLDLPTLPVGSTTTVQQPGAGWLGILITHTWE